MPLQLEIVTPRGVAYSVAGVDRVIMRRAEPRFDLGSELVVLPQHGEMLVRLPFHALRVYAGTLETGIEVDGGFAEVRDDIVTVLTPDARVGTSAQAGCPRTTP